MSITDQKPGPPDHLRAGGKAPPSGPARDKARPVRLGRNGPWLRWSWRDLRARWVQVLAIALVAALGTGTYVGLSAAAEWRRQSYDASYAALGAHSLKVSLATGTTASAGDLVRAAAQVAHPEWIAAASPQLVVPTQVDASTDGKTILVPGRVVGVDVSNGGPPVDRFDARQGRALAEQDIGAPAAVLDYHFAKAYGLPATGEVRLSGDRRLPYVGQVLQPDYFMILSEEGGFLAEAGYAVLFAPLPVAQALAGQPDQANELVVRVAPGADVSAVQNELEQSLAASLSGTATTVTPITADRGYRILYDDIDGDQRFSRVFALLILAGAAFAAFNLASRIVEAQRREIGIGMALGEPARWLAFRPMLAGFEIALLSTLLGLGVGMLIGNLVAGIMQGYYPMPVWLTPFAGATYAKGAALAVGLIFLATVLPVVRAVRVAPIDAIKVGARQTKPSGWASAVQHLPLPGNTIVQMPLRNTLRSPRRSILTALGIAAAITTLVAVIGMVDSFLLTIDNNERELAGSSPERVLVGIDGFQLAGSPTLKDLEAAPGVAAASEYLRVGGELSRDGTRFETAIDVVDFADPVWAPKVIEGTVPASEPGVVISRKAADDLGVGPGDTVRMRYPYREGLGYRWAEGDVKVAGIHPLAYRFATFLDKKDASLLNLQGIVNQVQVSATPGTTTEALQRTLFRQPGVASAQPVSAVTSVVRDRIGQFLDTLRIIEVAVLLLAVLIAFNSSSISTDERSREYATMFSFGVPTRTAMTMAMAESALIGVVATLIGILAGVGLLGWIVRVLVADSQPDLSIDVTVNPKTFAVAVLLGVGAVALAPLLTMRKLRRMKIPETLRVVE
ncbi:MAG: ABC transporter permease [Actinobacteria bacterium]|nr:ABC transporter permease [Actinomycetota bacterium]